MGRQCSICSAGAEVANEINTALAKGERLIDIAARSAFTKSSISRHARSCVGRKLLEEHRERKLNEYNSRVFVKGLDGETRLMWDAVPAPFWRRKREANEILNVRLCVQFDPVDVGKIIAKAHTEALEEDAARAAALANPPENT